MNAFSANGLRGRLVFISLLALLAGGGIYLFLRPGEFVFHRWLSVVGLDKLLNSARQSGIGNYGFIPDWLLYSLPNGLWAFAYALLITGIWLGNPSPMRYFWFATIPILVLGFEFLQGAGLIRGTFSFYDLAFGVSGLVSGVIVGFLLNKTKQL